MRERFTIDQLVYEVRTNEVNEIISAIVSAERFDYDLQIIEGEYLFFKLKPGIAGQTSSRSGHDRPTAA
ncbi:hypothetical protein [Pistricoccus aurantiacus]|uniref:hypothetical protein n=1 Tax=Pistricoccus aurantiacus TaxID=1883414 RepID=UPI00363C2378